MTKVDLFLGGLCLILDSKASGRAPAERALAALNSGVRWLQYRDKDNSRRYIYMEALRLRGLTRDFGAVFIVNDYVDIAAAVDADGVHLGQDDLPLTEAREIMGHKIIGISTHTLSEAQEAEKGGADYAGFGPVFHTTTKDAGLPKGTGILRDIKRHLKIPVVAIGGITSGNLSEVIEAGADAVAVASAILNGNIRENAEKMVTIINGMAIKA